MKITSTVIKGRGRGGELSYPTANIRVKKDIASGVYYGLVALNDKQYKAGIFIRPNSGILEAHLLDFKGDLYGQEIIVEIKDKLREVMLFKSDAEAKIQIGEDIKRIKFISHNL